ANAPVSLRNRIVPVGAVLVAVTLAVATLILGAARTPAPTVADAKDLPRPLPELITAAVGPRSEMPRVVGARFATTLGKQTLVPVVGDKPGGVRFGYSMLDAPAVPAELHEDGAIY